MVKNLPANTGNAKDVDSILRWGRSPGEGNGNPLQYSCLENPMDRGVWWGCKESDMTEQARMHARTCLLYLDMFSYLGLGTFQL